ncbi:hypothetical protein CVT26_008780 [Gymnopilus dilepis]|uniref:Uncharacterized protein n=1 Tax=Gymnopilus dilepis TaxID=231916 RepID=A0A409W9N0_9AGAR|nr:hypothetical protein CVT26_008780 [Gymnopilus dilepis]
MFKLSLALIAAALIHAAWSSPLPHNAQDVAARDNQSADLDSSSSAGKHRKDRQFLARCIDGESQDLAQAQEQTSDEVDASAFIGPYGLHGLHGSTGLVGPYEHTGLGGLADNLGSALTSVGAGLGALL